MQYNAIVKNIKDSILNGVHENIIKNINNIGNPIYKSVNSTNLPNVLFKLFIVIYINYHPYFYIFVYTYF